MALTMVTAMPIRARADPSAQPDESLGLVDVEENLSVAIVVTLFVAMDRPQPDFGISRVRIRKIRP